ncbi:MAG TPA: hypothetical protein VJP90_07315 [Paenarthrobacter sp.]|nr:hypothetical protein [Paenarthrobacter sp.]
MTLTSAPTTDQPAKAKQRLERSAAGTALGAFGLAAIIGVVAAGLHVLAQQSPRIGPVFAGWPESVDGSALAAVRWLLGDMAEPLFYKSELAALGLLGGAGLAWWAGRRRQRWAGGLSYGTGLWPWILASASGTLLLSNAAFGWMLDDGWQPTFVPFVCVAPAVVLVHGAGWKTCLSGAVLGAATTTPLALLLIPMVSEPLGLPSVVANVLAMSLGSVVSFMIIRRLPWLVGGGLSGGGPSTPIPALREPVAPEPKRSGRPNQPASFVSPRWSFRGDAVWAAGRVLKDFTETFFVANELASVGVILGVATAFVLNPGLPAYGSGLLPHVLFAQALASAAGVVLWRCWFRNDGWAATYAPVVSVAPAAVLAFGGSWTAILGGALLGALLAPPIARCISARLPAGFHPVIGNTAAMAVSTAVVLPVLGLLPH